MPVKKKISKKTLRPRPSSVPSNREMLQLRKTVALLVRKDKQRDRRERERDRIERARAQRERKFKVQIKSLRTELKTEKKKNYLAKRDLFATKTDVGYAVQQVGRLRTRNVPQQRPVKIPTAKSFKHSKYTYSARREKHHLEFTGTSATVSFSCETGSDLGIKGGANYVIKSPISFKSTRITEKELVFEALAQFRLDFENKAHSAFSMDFLGKPDFRWNTSGNNEGHLEDIRNGRVHRWKTRIIRPHPPASFRKPKHSR